MNTNMNRIAWRFPRSNRRELRGARRWRVWFWIGFEKWWSEFGEPFAPSRKYLAAAIRKWREWGVL